MIQMERKLIFMGRTHKKVYGYILFYLDTNIHIFTYIIKSDTFYE